MTSCRIRLIYCVALIVLMALPFVEKTNHWFPDVVLVGKEIEVDKPTWTLEAWFDGSAARQSEKYFESEIGFRGLFVKIMNQLNLSVFRRITGNKGTPMVLGRDNWLYEKQYVRFYRRRFSMGENVADRWARDVRLLQDRLADHGIAFLLVISPSKAEIYPEYLPRDCRPSDSARERASAYDVMLPFLEKHGIHFLDVCAYFKQIKVDSEPLFARTGTHWNYYGSFLAFQEALRQLRHTSGIRLPEPELADVQYRPPIGSDVDLEALLNVWWVMPRRKRLVPYPTVETQSVPMAARPGFLVVGDSFAYTLIDSINLSGVARDIDLLYYFRRHFAYACEEDPGYYYTHADMDEGPLEKTSLDWERLLFGKQVVILETNQILIPSRGWGFIRAALAALDERDATVEPLVAKDLE